jgi:hypothetical protein
MAALMTPAFSLPDWMRTVLAHVPGGLAVRDEASEDGFSYFAARRHRLPLRHLESFVTPLSPSGLPATLRDVSGADAARFLNRLAVPLLLRNVPESHEAVSALCTSPNRFQVLRRWQRACLDVSGSFDDWLATNFDHKRRKELKRLRARLSEQGKLDVKALAPREDESLFVANLLKLEAQGWKGRQGTALAGDQQLAEALRHGLALMNRQGRLRFWEITLDGKPVASLFALVNGSEAMLGKIAYDESFARYSPGVMIVVDATEALFAEPGIRFADSNAIPDHPMIDRIWRGRMGAVDVMVAGSNVSSAVFAAVVRWHGTKDAARTLIKHAYYRLAGRKPS